MRTRLHVAAILAGIAAIAVLAVLILGPGTYYPSPPSLTAHPVVAILGEILFVDPNGCIVHVRASGTSREQVACPGSQVIAVSWLDAGRIAYAEAGGFGAPVWTELNLETRAVTTPQQYAFPQTGDVVSVQGERVDFDRAGSVYRVTNGDRTKIFQFNGPQQERPAFLTWSPDGNWLLLRYREELWIIGRDGAVRGTLARTRRFGPQGAS